MKEFYTQSTQTSRQLHLQKYVPLELRIAPRIALFHLVMKYLNTSFSGAVTSRTFMCVSLQSRSVMGDLPRIRLL